MGSGRGPNRGGGRRNQPKQAWLPPQEYKKKKEEEKEALKLQKEAEERKQKEKLKDTARTAALVQMSTQQESRVYDLLRNVTKPGASSAADTDAPRKDHEDIEGITTELTKMGFSKTQVKSALEDDSLGQGRVTRDAVLDWLCMNLPEDSLPHHLKGKKNEVVFVKAKGPKPEDLTEGVMMLASYGFPLQECVDVMKKHSHCFNDGFYELLSGLGTINVDGVTPPSDEEIQSERSDEEDALKAIFDSEFTKMENGDLMFKLDLTYLGKISLHFHPRANKYPFQRILASIQGSGLSAQNKKLVMTKLAEEAANHIGTPAVFSVVSYLQESEQAISEEFVAAGESEYQPEKEVDCKIKKDKGKGKGRNAEAVAKYQGLLTGLDAKTDRTLERLDQRRKEEEAEEERRRKNREYTMKLLQEEAQNEESQTEESPARGASSVTTEASKVKKGNNRPSGSSGNGNTKKDTSKKAVGSEQSPSVRQVTDRGDTVINAKYVPLPRNAEKLAETSRKLKQEFAEKLGVPKFKDMQKTRKKLPASSFSRTVVDAVGASQVVIVSGETGCGKTTQVPQFVLDDMISRGEGASCNMICTQPRRLSAIAVAERVAEERLESIGETVGYQIRLEAERSRKTRLLFCTTGVLLRRLQGDPFLREVSHIFVDEVHERGIDTDFLLIILKEMLKQRKDIKLILMSASLNAEAFSKYFGNAPIVEIPGRTYPVTEYFVEDLIEKSGYALEDDSPYIKKTTAPKKEHKKDSRVMDDKARYTEVVTLDGVKQAIGRGYSDRTYRAVARMDDEKVNYDLVEEAVRYIHHNLKDGAILIFMPGLMEISTLYDQLMSVREFRDGGLLICPLHSTLSTVDQHKIFNRPPRGVRKVVIATNIAETSITIDDVVFVIDSGRVKENRYDSQKKMACLMETWIARASARQRKGRAGRVQEGYCFRLYSSLREKKMSDYQAPEILRTSLDGLCLNIKAIGLGRPEAFLSKALDPVGELTVRAATATLTEVGALDADQQLTPLGRHLAALPVDTRVGKMMLFGAIFQCLDPVLTIAASISLRSPFVAPMEKRDQADEAKRRLADPKSDHMTVLKAYNGWRRAASRNQYCSEHFLSRKTLEMITDLKKQFAQLLLDIGFIETDRSRVQGDKGGGSGLIGGEKHNINAENHRLVKAILCAGLYPQVFKAVFNPKNEKDVKFTSSRGDVMIHPCSVMFNQTEMDSPWFVYHELVKTTQVYVRDCTMTSPYALLLFGGDLTVQHEKQLITIDNWITFKSPPKTAVLVKELRALLDELLVRKIENPSVDISSEGYNLIQAVAELLSTERTMGRALSVTM